MITLLFLWRKGEQERFADLLPEKGMEIWGSIC